MNIRAALSRWQQTAWRRSVARPLFAAWACLFGAALGLAACETQPPMTTKTLQQPSQVTQTIRMGEYRVAPGDRLRVVVLSDTELSGDYEVDSTGVISPRMATRVPVVGMTTVEIEAMLKDRYRADGLLRNPKLTVDLVARRPFYILGEITKPGSFPYVNGINVVQAIAIAGGYTRRASKTRITVKRFNSPAGEEETVTEDSPIGPGDVIYVPERWF
ncbi:MAG: polysaccharide export protein [Rhodospirillales bacterium]|nr:polysaccharide export protein [Rhodospirillales bacterium]